MTPTLWRASSSRRVGHERVRLIVTDPDAATNPKVAQLLALERAASGEVVVVSDSNVRVTPRYLDPLLAELSFPGVGAVSNLVAGTGERTLGAAMENLQLGAIIAPGIAASAFVLGRTITLGKSMAMWREPLQSIGGFARVAHVLSDDHMLGRAFARAGYQVRVSLWPVENRNVDCSLERTIARHTRWAQTRRALAPAGVRDRAGPVARRDHHLGVCGLTDADCSASLSCLRRSSRRMRHSHDPHASRRRAALVLGAARDRAILPLVLLLAQGV